MSYPHTITVVSSSHMWWLVNLAALFRYKALRMNVPPISRPAVHPIYRFLGNLQKRRKMVWRFGKNAHWLSNKMWERAIFETVHTDLRVFCNWPYLFWGYRWRLAIFLRFFLRASSAFVASASSCWYTIKPPAASPPTTTKVKRFLSSPGIPPLLLLACAFFR